MPLEARISRARIKTHGSAALIGMGLVLSCLALVLSCFEGLRPVGLGLDCVTFVFWAFACARLAKSPAVEPNPASVTQSTWTPESLPGTTYRYVRRPDGSGYFAYLSSGSISMFGVTPDAALKDPELVMGCFHPQDRIELRQNMDAAAANQTTDWWCGRVTTGGVQKWLTITARAGILPTGETYWDGLALDDTSRQQELVESKKFFNSIVENLPDMVFIKDAEELRFVLLNKAGEDLLGFDRSELMGKNDYDFFPKEQADSFIAGDRCVLAGTEFVEFGRDPITTKYKGVRILHTKKIPLTDSDGNPKYLLGISEDVTDRVRTQEALEESRHTLNAILNHTTTPIFLHDEEGRVILLNESALHMLDAGVEDILGCLPEEFMTPESARAYRQAELEVRTTGHSVEAEEVFLRSDGARTFITIRFPLLDSRGAVYAVGTIATDITEHKRIMHEVRKAKEEAEDANLAKSVFLSRMSHELRTPLNAILGFAQLLEFEDLGDEHEETVAYILEAGRHLLRLINEVLDISRIESGNFSVSVEPIQISEVVEAAVSMIAPLADARSIKVMVGEIAHDMFFRADRQRFSQALINLLSNAVKYNEEGGSVEVTFHFAEEGQGRIHVLDTGKGISQDKVDRLFVPFDRLGAETTKVEGTGLGLSLSRRLVEAMHGEMGLVNSDEAGSVFYIQLPMADKPDGIGVASLVSKADTAWKRD